MSTNFFAIGAEAEDVQSRDSTGEYHVQDVSPDIAEEGRRQDVSACPHLVSAKCKRFHFR